jgi:hypothetical protein
MIKKLRCRENGGRWRVSQMIAGFNSARESGSGKEKYLEVLLTKR